MIDAPPMPTDDERQRAYAQVSWNVISDTVTLPSALMRTSMASAVCGDEGYRTDPVSYTHLTLPTNREV